MKPGIVWILKVEEALDFLVQLRLIPGKIWKF
jgi:hypothetical protein